MSAYDPKRTSQVPKIPSPDAAHFEGTDGKVFEAYRELIEQVASDAFDAEVSLDETGCVLTKEALDRVGRSA